MNKVIASTGLLVIGATSLQAQEASFDNASDAKPWSIGAVVRGFYDDNSLNTNSNEIESFGIEFGPSLAYDTSWNGGASRAEASYDYRYRWYEAEARNEDDQYHIFNIDFDHDVSENIKVSVDERLVITNEPTILDQNVVTAIRLRQDALRNTFSTRIDWDFADTLSAGVSYANRYYNYEQALFSNLLDRTEHLIGVDGRKALGNQKTDVVIGYQYGMVDYNGDTIVRQGLAPISSSTRDNDSHYIFTGADHQFNPNLYGSLRAGAQFVDYSNAVGGDTSTTSPYVDANLTYNFTDAQTIFGVRHARNATDVSGFLAAPVLDQETTTVYGALQYNFTSSIVGTVNGQAQFSEFNGGSFQNANENLYILGATLGYQLNANLLVEAGYTYTDLISDDIGGRDFSRNFIFLGVTATY